MSHLVDSVAERIVTAKCGTEELPVIDLKLMTSRGSLSLRNSLKGADKLY
jgi:hypothetical protein